jgi:hypothetical protein
MRERLLNAGLVNVSVVAGAPPPGSETPAGSQARPERVAAALSVSG